MNNKMKTFIIILSFVFVNLIGICGLRAQHVNGLADLDRMYSLIPDTLTSEAYLKQLEQVEMQFRQVMDTIQNERNQNIASLMRYKGLLWGLGRYVLAHDDASVREVMKQKMVGLDLDVSELELLPDNEIINLINGYINFYYPEMGELERATYVLYNIKSEKVRNSYVLPALIIALKQWGYTDEIEGVIEDIDICSKTEATRQKAHELKDWYYPVRKGEVAPEIEGVDEYGKDIKLSDFKGKIVFIDVWATWCGGCVEGLPYFMALKDKYKDSKDIVFLTITEDFDGMENTWKKFLKEKKYSGKVPHLWLKDREKFDKDYCITGIPRYILIDKEGRIVNAWHIAAKHEFFSFVFDTELQMLTGN